MWCGGRALTAVAHGQRNSMRARPAEPDIAGRLLDWYDRERRQLPWRYAPGVKADPYRVWLSEIMLQQTVVKAVVPFFDKFIKRWPTVEALARADLDDVLAAWAGLGYYSRARNLHTCAKRVASEFHGTFPDDEATLRTLPGIGPYTAAAVVSIGHGAKATPVDGNVERVVSRLFAVEQPLPASKPLLKQLAAGLTPDQRAGDFAQGLMDLGATICTPKRPSCLMCPLHGECAAHKLGVAASLPRRLAKSARPVRFGHAFVAMREDGHVLLRQRVESGLLARMMEVPSGDWLDAMPSASDSMRAAPVRGDWWPVPGTVIHMFTHFRLELMVHVAVVPNDCALNFWADAARCRWVPRRSLTSQALPSVMRKIIAHALKEA